MIALFVLLAGLLAVVTPQQESPRRLKIVQVTDTHVGRNPPTKDAARLRTFLRQLVAQESPVDLWAFTGDLTHKGLKSQFEAFRDALDVLPKGARVVHVKGNHDEGKPEVKGEEFEAVLGDPTRAFDLNGYRIVTAPKLTHLEEDGAWLMKTLRAAKKPVLLFVHYYPRRAWLDMMRGTRLKAVFSGHWHGNQSTRTGDIYSFNTASTTLGGWDFSPPVARVVELDGDKVNSRLVPAAPRESAVAWIFPDHLLVQVATAKGIQDEMQCTAGKQTWTLHRKSFYTWDSASESSPSRGEVPEGRRGRDAATTTNCTSGAWSSKITANNAAAAGIRWARPLGRMQYGGDPAVADDRVIVTTRTGLEEDRCGAVHALDLETGATLWTRDLTGHPAGRPATDTGRAYVSTLDGTIHALDLTTGETTWTFRLSDVFPPMFVDHWVITGPTLRDGRLHTCYQKGPYVVDAATGALIDREEEAIDGFDVLGVSPARLHGDHLFCATFTEGLFSWTLDPKGALSASWKDTEVRVTAAPTVDAAGHLWVRTLRDLRAYAPTTGEAAAPPIRLDYLRVPSGPLSLGDAIVTSGRRGRPAALKADGTVVWTHSLGKPLATFELNRYDHPAPLASPVLSTEGVVMAGPDGLLRVLDAADGAVRRKWLLGAPLASTPATDGDRIFTVDLGGTVWCTELRIECNP